MKINHLGIATKDIAEALKFWEDALGLENVHMETVEDQKVRVAMLPIGESRIELLEPTSEDSPITKFLEKRGGGINETKACRSAFNRRKTANRCRRLSGRVCASFISQRRSARTGAERKEELDIYLKRGKIR